MLFECLGRVLIVPTPVDFMEICNDVEKGKKFKTSRPLLSLSNSYMKKGLMGLTGRLFGQPICSKAFKKDSVTNFFTCYVSISVSAS